MKNIKKLSLIALAISPLTSLAFIPNVVRHTNLKRCSLNNEEVIFFSPKKEGFIGIPKYFKYSKELFETNTLKAFPLWSFIERLDSFDGEHYFSDYAKNICKVLDVKYEDVIPNSEEANYLNVSNFINKKLKELEEKNVKTKEVDFILKDYVDNVKSYWESKEKFYENVKNYLKKVLEKINIQLNNFVNKYKEIVLKEKYDYIEKLNKELEWAKKKEQEAKKGFENAGHIDLHNRMRKEWNAFTEEVRKIKKDIEKNYENINNIKLIEYKA